MEIKERHVRVNLEGGAARKVRIAALVLGTSAAHALRVYGVARRVGEQTHLHGSDPGARAGLMRAASSVHVSGLTAGHTTDLDGAGLSGLLSALGARLAASGVVL